MANILIQGTTGDDSLDLSTLALGWYQGVDYVTLGGKDKVIGSVHNDTFTLGRDAEVIDGNSGWDTVIYTNSTSGVEVDLNKTVQHGGYAEGDELYRIENVTGSQFGDALIGNAGVNYLSGQGGDDKIYAGGGDDRVFGGDGNDSLFGEADNDIIFGDNGADTIDGGSGRDTVDYSASTAGVEVNLNQTTQSGGFAQGDRLYSIENVTGSQYTDALVGDAGDNVLDGQGGNDKIYAGDGSDTVRGGDGNDFLAGEGGNDTIEGGAGNDTMRGGAGADRFDGGDGIDTVDYSDAAAGVQVYLGSPWGFSGGLSGDAARDTYVNVENLRGSAGNDILFGDADANVISGLGGNDTIVGAAGADTLDGGTGTDLLSYVYSSAAVQVDLSTNQASGGDAEGDVIANFENVAGSEFGDQLIGSGVANTLYGDAGADLIVGNGGNDRITGAAGNDVLIGGTESDTFVFAPHTSSGATPEGSDLILDFAVGTDHLEFQGSAVDSLSDLHFFQSGSNTLITYDDAGGTSSITLVGVNTLQLLQHAQTDFLFT
jgi:Ca2+-binding RTX toxin-like protein